MKLARLWGVILGLGCAVAAPVEARELRVLTFNIWGLKSPFLIRPSRIPRIAERIEATGADIIGIQEAFDPSTALLERIPAYPHLARGNRKGPLGGDGLLVLSRWPIVASAWRAYARCSWNDCFTPKGMLHARVRVPDGETVDVFVTHLNAHSGNERIRLLQAQELWEFIAERSDGSPLLLLGDFNTEPGSDSHAFLSGWAGLRDAHGEFVEQNPALPPAARDGYSWNPARNSNIPGRKGSVRFDYIWMGDSGSRGRLEVLATQLAFDETVAGRHLSDHFAVLAELAWHPERAGHHRSEAGSR
ncbi:MAG: endonuclease/exonuclease/phosphatase family protein [Bdellovibrionales bacterium]|nr:endonuclease/exonuclease/phosphatase family protein [Bdellovibrionales bacterium]